MQLQQEQELSLPFGERVTFLCLCKEKITKRGAFQQPSGWSSTPCLRAHAATRRGSTPPAGFFDTTSLSWRKTTCIHARRPSGSSQWLRRCGRGPAGQRPEPRQEQLQLQLQLQLQRLPLPGPPLRFAQGRGLNGSTKRGGRSGVTPGLCAASASLFQLHPVFAARPKQLHAQNHRRFE